MDTNPEEYASSIQKYADTYFQKREELSAAIAGYNRRINRIFLFDRCMNGGVLLASLMMICGIGAGSRMMAIFGGLATICMSIAPTIVGIHRVLDFVFISRRESERQLEIMDEAWRHWSTA